MTNELNGNVCQECGQPEETAEGVLFGSECPGCGEWYCDEHLSDHEEECRD